MLYEHPSHNNRGNRDVSQAIINMLVGGANNSDIERRICLITLKELQQQQPYLVDLIHLCALPPLLDSDVVGVLRGDREDAVTNRHWLHQLRQFSFVKQTWTGIVYDEQVRGFLLGLWQKRPNA